MVDKLHYHEQVNARLDTIFQALANSTRRAMLRQLADQPANVTELAAPFQMSMEAVSKHIRVLERAGLVDRTIQGRTHLCRLNPHPLADADQWMQFYARFWNDRLDTLDALLRAEDQRATPRTPRDNQQDTATA